MAFTDNQTTALTAKLRARHVKQRQHNGMTLSYIEGWHAISEANRIFGFDGWDRETVHMQCIWQLNNRNHSTCAYLVRVRIRVHTDDVSVIREGTGCGEGTGATPGEAHESAIKEAETDATKRALTTFGNPFGLALCDGKKRGVTRDKGTRLESDKESWILRNSRGEETGRYDNPTELCSGMKQALLKAHTPNKIGQLWTKNLPLIERIAAEHPNLVSADGQHYVDFLRRLYELRLDSVSRKSDNTDDHNESTEPTQVNGVTPWPKRIRDKAHLLNVAALPCLVCGREPAQAHHVRYTQPRAMSKKVSDEWTVPLCNLHHRELHDAGNEENWWQKVGIDPVPEAEKLWSESRVATTSQQ